MSSDKNFLIDLCSTEQIIILIRIFWSFNSSAAAVSFPSSSFFKSYQKVLVAFSYLMNIFFIFFKLLFSDNWSNLNWNSGTAEYLLSPIKSQPLILGEACALCLVVPQCLTLMKLFNNEFSNFSLSKQFPCVFLIFFSERSYSNLSRRRLFSPNLFGFFERAFSLLFQRGMRSHLVLISRYFKLEGPSHLVVSKLL